VKNVRFHDEARLELVDQVSYYEEAQSGLGQRFAAEIESAVSLAASRPSVGLKHKLGTHRVFPRRFPFSIVYTIQGSEIVILAIAHFKRKPGYWRNRKNDG